MDEQKEKKQGHKGKGQKYKSLLVWDILLKKTDEDHALQLKDIKEHLAHYGITAERHSIKRDIDDILALLNKEIDFDLDELEIEERDLLGYEVEYDAAKHGYKVSRRPYDFEELRLLAECVRASKFISKSQEEHLLAAIENLCSDYQIEELQNEVYLVGRNKTTNKHIMAAMLKVNQAIRENKKITFRYQKFTIKDRTQQVDRRGGATYKISPFKLIISDGYYYVLAWNPKKDSTITFRLDRMKGVEIINEPREGNLEFAKINMEAYTQQHFGMFSGDKKRVSLRFTNNLLDTMVDRFGTGADVSYYADGERHFVVNAEIAISDQFYGWLCGFRKMAMNDDESQFCSACGAPLHGKSSLAKTVSADTTSNDDLPSIVMNLVGFFLPLIGFIMFCFMYNRTPRQATCVGKWALIGFISNIILIVLTFSKIGIRFW